MRSSCTKRALVFGGLLFFYVTLVSHVAAQTCVTPPNGLISWWDGDAVSGTVVEDIQNGNDGALINGATTAPGKVGQAFSFDGIDDYIQIDNVDFAQGDYSLEGWFNNFTVTGSRHMIGVSAAVGTIPSIVLIQIDDTSLRAAITGGTNVLTGPASTNAFHHFALVKEGSALTLYVDGAVIGSDPVVTTFATPLSIVLGANVTNLSQANVEGLIDEISVYNRALSAQEVQDIYDADSAGKCKVPVCNGIPATLVGTGNNDTLIGSSDDDVIVGRGGDDLIKGRGGNDLICGGAGNDTLEGGSGDDDLRGGADADLLKGGGGNDTLRGGGGNDDLRGNAGNDLLLGGAANDVLRGGGEDDDLRGGSGDDDMRGGSGTDDQCRGGSGSGDTASGCEFVTGVP